VIHNENGRRTRPMNNLEKLTEENFDSWKLQMKSVLVYNELWAYI